MLKRRFRTILTARLLLEYREHLLFLQQTPRNGDGFTLPGGKIEGEEFAKEALIREAFEEVGIVLSAKMLKMVHVTHRKIDSMVEVIFFFHAHHDTLSEPTIKEPEKFQNAIWLPLDEPPAKLTSVLTHAFDAWRKGKYFSQYTKSKKKVGAIIVAPVVELSALKADKKTTKKPEKALKKEEKKVVDKKNAKKKGVKKEIKK